MFCTNCGSQIPNGTNNCPNCGAPQNLNTNNNQMPNNFGNQNINNPQMNNNPQNFNGQNMNNFNRSKKNNLPIILGGIIVVIIAIILVLFLNKGGKTVTCKKTQNLAGINAEIEVSTKYNSNSLDSVSLIIEYKLENQYLSNLDTYYEAIKNNFEKYQNSQNVKTNITKGNNSIKVEINTSRKGIEELSELSITKNDENPEQLITEMQNQGYTCTQK